MPTIRQQMIELLSRESCGVRDLSRMLRISEKEIYTHLSHVQRTAISSGRRFHLTPAECLSCGYVFSKRSRFTRPSRCVRCKNERISEPVFQIGRVGHSDDQQKNDRNILSLSLAGTVARPTVNGFIPQRRVGLCADQEGRPAAVPAKTGDQGFANDSGGLGGASLRRMVV